MAVKIMIKELRERCDISQNELARRLGMSLNNIQKMEYQKAKSVPFDTLEKLCTVFQCEIGDLLKLVPDDEVSA